MAPRPIGSERYGLPVDGPAGARLLRVCWRFNAGVEPLDQPKIGGVYIAGVPSVPRLGCIIAPVGQTLSSRASATISSLMEQLVARARAELELSRFLLNPPPDGPPPDLLSSQNRFERIVRQADIQIGFLSGNEDKAKFAAVLADLHNANDRLIRQLKLEPQTTQSGSLHGDGFADDPPLAALPDSGRCYYWNLANPKECVTVSLAATSDDWARRRRFAPLLIASFALLGFSFFPNRLAGMRALVPEFLLLLATVGILAWGLSLVGVMIAVVGCLIRLVWAARSAVAWFVPVSS